MAAVIEAHAENRVAWIDEREIRRGVRLRTRVRLHVRIARTEQLLRTIDRELLGDIDVLAAAVVALARIAFGVLVRQHRALRFEHARAGVVFRCDQLDMVFLTLTLGAQCGVELGIESGDLHVCSKHREPSGLRRGPNCKGGTRSGTAATG